MIEARSQDISFSANKPEVTNPEVAKPEWMSTLLAEAQAKQGIKPSEEQLSNYEQVHGVTPEQVSEGIEQSITDALNFGEIFEVVEDKQHIEDVARMIDQGWKPQTKEEHFLYVAFLSLQIAGVPHEEGMDASLIETSLPAESAEEPSIEAPRFPGFRDRAKTDPKGLRPSEHSEPRKRDYSLALPEASSIEAPHISVDETSGEGTTPNSEQPTERLVNALVETNSRLSPESKVAVAVVQATERLLDTEGAAPKLETNSGEGAVAAAQVTQEEVVEEKKPSGLLSRLFG